MGSHHSLQAPTSLPRCLRPDEPKSHLRRSHNPRPLGSISGAGSSVGGGRVDEGVGKGNKMFSMAFGLKACALPDQVLAKKQK